MTPDTGIAPDENRLRIALPDPSICYEQDSEWCLVERDGEWREIRFHDYAEIYPIEGLYERLFYEILHCASPPIVRSLLQAELEGAGGTLADLRVLDLGAGNGIMAEELTTSGVGTVVGIDIIPEAREAAQRDRPGVYEDYRIVDMTALGATDRDALARHRFNGLTCVAALGFGDIPPVAFREAFNLVEDDGWVAFTIKDGFLSDRDTSGFAGLIKDAIESGSLEVRASERYQHRLSTAGEPLHYQAIVGRKTGTLAG
jgi:2-polyprenyl-3-methyl-5-hydroxy-6-metoxy-1,4-benzoquinol methylase